MNRWTCRSLLLIVFCTPLCAQVPVLNQPLGPAAAAPGGAGFTITATGTNFASHAFLNWNGSPRTTTVFSSSSLQATISAADIAHATTASITVVNPFPFGGSSNPVYFSVRQPATAVAFAPEPGVTPLAGPVVVGDFNNDRKLDLVVGQTNSDGTGSILFYPGKGDGTFGSPTTTLTSLPVLSVMARDFNGDGRLDVLIGVHQLNFGPAQGIVLLGNGAGHFQAQTAFGSGDSGGPIAVGDVNGDGILDVIFEGQVQGSGLLYTYLGKGDGTFTMKSVQGINSVGVDAAIGDFNGDGKLDIAVPELHQVDILLGNGDGTFQTYVPYSVSCQNGPVVTADLNGDGHLDLAMGDLCILLGNGDGTFTVGPNFGSGGTAGLAIADFNGDGKLDVAVGGGPIKMYLGNGDGTFQNAITSGGFSNNLMEVLPIGDFNGDGKIDVATYGSAAVQVGLQTPLYVSPNPVSFGSQKVGTHGAAKIVTLSNIGPQQIPLSSITLGGADPGDFTANDGCGTKLQGEKTCEVKVFFAPTATGARTASLIITYTGIDSPQTVGLSGTGK